MSAAIINMVPYRVRGGATKKYITENEKSCNQISRIEEFLLLGMCFCGRAVTDGRGSDEATIAKLGKPFYSPKNLNSI